MLAVMRDKSGDLSLWCDGKRLAEVSAVAIDRDDDGMQTCYVTLPMSAVMLGESGPREQSVIKNNVTHIK